MNKYQHTKEFEEWQSKLLCSELHCVVCLVVQFEFRVETHCCAIICSVCEPRQQVQQKCPICQINRPRYRVPSVIEQCYFNRQQVVCPCGAQFERPSHEEHYERCPLRTTKCYYCREQFQVLEVSSHEDGCPEAILSCVYCTQLVKRRYLQTHIQFKCPETQVQCLYCDQIYRRKDFQDHETLVCPELNYECQRCGAVCQKDYDHESVCPMRIYVCQVCECVDVAKNKKTHNCIDSLKNEIAQHKRKVTELNAEVQQKSQLIFQNAEAQRKIEIVQEKKEELVQWYPLCKLKYDCEKCIKNNETCYRWCRKWGLHSVRFEDQVLYEFRCGEFGLSEIAINNETLLEVKDDELILRKTNIVRNGWRPQVTSENFGFFSLGQSVIKN